MIFLAGEMIMMCSPSEYSGFCHDAISVFVNHWRIWFSHFLLFPFILSTSYFVLH